ncbi:hypothetical protein L7F22_010356 [Adiantum nelumboides]|nr:hypothetical protein [Adiantum nelumboides]
MQSLEKDKISRGAHFLDNGAKANFILPEIASRLGANPEELDATLTAPTLGYEIAVTAFIGAAAKLNEIKELRYNAKTEPKDLKMKVQKAKQFLERGYKVKFVGNFKGFVEEEVDRREEGKMIDSVISMLDDISVIEQGPRYESRLVWVMLKHTKFMKVKKKPKPAVQTTKTQENEKNEALVGNQ